MTTLSRTTGTPTLGTKFTCSGWFKFSDFPNGGGVDRWLFGEYTDSYIFVILQRLVGLKNIVVQSWLVKLQINL